VDLGAAGTDSGPTARGFDVNLGGDHFGKLPNGYFPPYDVPNVEGRDREYLSETFPNVTSQGPLRAGKGTLYEGGIRVPTVVAWPGVLEGRVSTQPVVGSDLFPTFVDLANAREHVPDDHVVDGHSLVPFFERDDSPDRDLFWHFPAYLAAGARGRFRTTPVSVVRSGRLKLHHFHEGDRDELYDLRADVGETEDLASERPEIRRELRRRLDDWLASTGARLPRRRGL